MTTPHTPYALLEHVPLSECREIHGMARGVHNGRNMARSTIRIIYLRRALAAVSNQLKLVTAERDQLRRDLDAMRGEL